MNKLNPLLDAMNDIDDVIVSEAAPTERRRPRYFKPMMIAAAAAVAAATVLFAFTGFEESYKGDGKNKLEIHYQGKTVRSFYFNLKTWDIAVPEEYRIINEGGNPILFKRMYGMLPSELFEQFGVSPLMNDNFTENTDFKPRYDVYGYDDNGELVVVETDYGYPILEIFNDEICFDYRLYDKKRQKNIGLIATYVVSDDYSSGGSIGVDDDSAYEIIKLKDGSKCYVDEMGAEFSFDGVLYRLISYDVDEDFDELSVELTKQILKDLGVY